MKARRKLYVIVLLIQDVGKLRVVTGRWEALSGKGAWEAQ